MRTVLLALDGSDSALFAALTATNLFGSETNYLAVHVEPTHLDAAVWGPVYGYGYPAIPPADLHDPTSRKAVIEDARRIAAEQTAELGVEAKLIGEAGDPAEAIRRLASEQGVDVVVVGDNQRGWLSRLFDVSVTKNLLRSTGVPILVVPAPDDL
jgi:nucleotide-binding universal stress UspA family protein